MTVAVLVVVALVAVGIPVARFIRSEWNRPTPANSTTSALQAKNQSQEPPPIAAPAPQTKSAAEASNSAALAQAALELKRRQEQEKADAEMEAQRQAALELAKKQEAEKAAALESAKQQAKGKIFNEIKSSLTNQVALLSKYRSDGQSRLDNNTNKIAKVASSSKKYLNEINDRTRVQMLQNLQNQENFLKQFQDTLPVLISSPQADVQQINSIWSNSVAKFEMQRQQMTVTLDSLDTTISNAPPPRGFLFFK